MSPDEHAAEAERLLDMAERWDGRANPIGADRAVAAAHVHALLAHRPVELPCELVSEDITTEDRLREVIAANPYLGTWDEWVDHYDKLTVQARSVMAHLHGRHDDSDLPVEFCLLCTTFRLAVPSTREAASDG